MKDVSYTIGLHMHQSLENFELLFDTNHWEATQVIYFVVRPVVRFVQKFAKAYDQIKPARIILRQIGDILV